MILKGVVEEDFVNYKTASMFLAFPHCTFKCEKEYELPCCQNSELIKNANIAVSTDEIVERYLENRITKSMVLGGLEPLDSFQEVIELIDKLRRHTLDMVIIYTGYNENEIGDKIEKLSGYKNIIVKFGRFKPNDMPIQNDILGIKLSSRNQYAKQIS